MDGLCQELPAYLARAEGVSFTKLTAFADLAVMKVEWWRQNEDNLPYWTGAVKMVLLIQPSSVAAEWIFSLLRATFSSQQQTAFKIMWRPA